MRLKTYKMGDRLPDYRLDPPDYPDPEQCPECGEEMEEDARGEAYRCTSEECGHEEAMPEDPRISAYEDRMMDDGGWC